LASIALPQFVVVTEENVGDEGGEPAKKRSKLEEECCLLRGRGRRAYFDFLKLKEVTKVVTHNLNRIINLNKYPVPEAQNSNMRHRPIGIGVQVGIWGKDGISSKQ
jgi:ribonucleotide reductase alpha subunit